MVEKIEPREVYCDEKITTKGEAGHPGEVVLPRVVALEDQPIIPPLSEQEMAQSGQDDVHEFQM